MKGQVVYKLQGKSLEAAKELEQFAEAYWKAQPPVVYPINMLDLQNRSRAIYAGMMEKLQAERPDLVKSCGLDKPVVRVSGGQYEEWPRAYAAWPEIFSTYTGPKSEYFMYAPVGHDGSVFKPEDALELNEKQAERAGNLLWAGGWQDNAPFAHRPDEGTSVPANFDPKKAPEGYPNYFADADNTVRVFKAGGASLAALEDLKAREQAHSAATTALFDHIKSMAPETMQLRRPDGSSGDIVNVYANLSMREAWQGNPPEVMISVRIEHTGEPVHVADTDGYIVTGPASGGDVRIVPNLATEAGKKFRDLLADPNIARADVRNYPALRYPAAKDDLNGQFQEAAADDYGGLPIRRTFGSDEYLIYRVERKDNDKSLPGPHGAVEVSPQAFLWLEADSTDRSRGITPPPMPPEIAAELDALKPQPRGSAPQPAP